MSSFDDDRPAAPAPPAPGLGDAETLLHRVVELIRTARPMPLSASAMINKDEVLTLLEDAVAKLPDELRHARWMLKEREEFLAKVQREADDLLDVARNQAERMVQRTEVVQQAKREARRFVDEAEANARRLAREAEDYCDQKLASFEIVLDRTLRTVQAGREKLQAVPAVESDPEPEELGPRVFDQEAPDPDEV